MSAATATAPSPNQQSQPQVQQPTQSTQPPPLWSIPIEVLGLTGDFASGKTLFALSISPGPSTLIYDTEKSAKPYQSSLGFDRVDLPGEMLKTHPNGYKPIDLFNCWWRSVKSLPVGKYRVIALDTVSEIESGLVAYVRENPSQFGYTAAQFARGTALVWGAVKDFWKAILTDLASRCETFVFTSHLRREFAGDRPTSTKTPKGKETLMELASLYLWLDRSPDKKGNVPAQPSATVLKSRLSSAVVLPNGLLDIRPTLPPRMPIATPASVRFYMNNPPDYDKLKAEERVRETEISEAEIEALKLARAEAERDAAALSLERYRAASTVAATGTANGASHSGNGATNRPTSPATSIQSPAANGSVNGSVNGQANGHANSIATTTVADVSPAVPHSQPANPQQPTTQQPAQQQQQQPAPPATNRAVDLSATGPRPEQLDAIVAGRNRLLALGLSEARYKDALDRRGVQSARQLTPDAADEFIVALNKKAAQLEAERTTASQQPATAAVGQLPN